MQRYVDENLFFSLVDFRFLKTRVDASLFCRGLLPPFELVMVELDESAFREGYSEVPVGWVPTG